MARTSGVVWTERMDKELEGLRLLRRVAWKAVAIRTEDGEAVPVRECQKRLKLLKEGRVVAGAPARKAPPEPTDRDGLIWLRKKKRLSLVQAEKGLWYRDLAARARTGADIKSCLASAGSGGGGGGVGLPTSDGYVDSAAQLEFFVVRSMILGGQVDLLTVMDGVCGLGHTVRFLAGGDQVRAAQLEAALRIALDLIIEAHKAKAAARTVAKAA